MAQPLQHSSQEEVGLFVGHILVREVGEGIQEHDQPDRLGSQQGRQAFTNAEIIRQGYGFAYTRFPFKHLEEFRQMAREAWEAKRGLWGTQ